MRALKIGLNQLLNRCVLHVFTTRKNTEDEGETLAGHRHKVHPLNFSCGHFFSDYHSHSSSGTTPLLN